MSSHYIYVACTTEGCTSHESIYTGEAYTELFDDSGPDSWEGETICVRCKECQERGDLVSVEDEARTEAVEALDRLTQIALDNTSVDAHEAVYEDAKRVRGEWQASRLAESEPQPEAAPAKPVSDTDREELASVINRGSVQAFVEGGRGSRELSLGSADAVLTWLALRTAQPVQVEDERIFAWEEVAKHPAFTQCYPQERPLIVSVIARLDELVSMEQTMNELAPSRLAQQVQVEVTDEMVEKAAQAFGGLTVTRWSSTEEWERNAVRSSMRRALSAALTPTPAVPVPEVIPGTRAALDGLSIRTGGGDQ